MSGIDPATARALSHRLAVEQSEHRLPSVAAGLVRGGDLVWSDAVGTLDGRSEGGASTGRTQYRIGSITKTFVAVEVLRMRDEGLLDLNDALGRHVDDTLFGQVTIAQLLSHTSGLQAETNGPWWERVAGGTWAELMASKPALKFRPGAKFHYSNVGYAVLGELVARLRGLPWDEAVRRELLEPLGMRRTCARPQDPAAHGLGVHPLADLLHVEPEHDAAAMAPAGWTGLDGYYAGETLTVVRDRSGRVSHLDLGSFRFSRTPYDPAADISGGVDPSGWH